MENIYFTTNDFRHCLFPSLNNKNFLISWWEVRLHTCETVASNRPIFSFPDVFCNSVSYAFLLLRLCILIDKYALFCIFFANWQSPATLTEVFPCFFLGCKANDSVYLAKTGHGPHSSLLLNCVVLCIVCV